MKKPFIKVFLTIVVLALGIFAIRNINTLRTERLSEVAENSLKATAYMAGLNREEFDKSSLENTDVVKIDDGVVQGYNFKPKNQKSNDVFITLGGSEGDIDYLHSSFLSENGYNTYAFYYFGAKNQNPELVDVELRDFEAMLDYIKKENKEIGNITLMGTSKGAEMALLLANYYPDKIDKLVLYSPSSYIWQGLSSDYQNVKSSWTYDGEELEFLDFDSAGILPVLKMMFKGIVNSPMEFRTFYDGAMRSSGASKFRIPTNNIRSKTLIFAGGDDRMWDSATMGNHIQSSIADAQIHVYEDAGHVFFGPSVYNNVSVGGTYEENVRALIDSNEKLLEFIK